MYYLIHVVSDPVWGIGEDDYHPSNFHKAGDLTYIYFQAGGGPVPDIISKPEMAGSSTIGAWEANGSLSAVDQAAYTSIRPLGNRPSHKRPDGSDSRGGEATGSLDYAAFAGHQRRWLAADSVYPPENTPIQIQIRHKELTAGPNTKYGFRAEVVGESARDVAKRSISAYADEECTDLLYTVNAFKPQASEWQTDDDDVPIDVWAAQPAMGQAEDEQVALHLSLVKSGVQEGYETLGLDDAQTDRLYWEETQDTGSLPDE